MAPVCDLDEDFDPLDPVFELLDPLDEPPLLVVAAVKFWWLKTSPSPGLTQLGVRELSISVTVSVQFQRPAYFDEYQLEMTTDCWYTGGSLVYESSNPRDDMLKMASP
jgi:hypothetical protein